MKPALSILYRGPLSSCNYACSYCPFAKREETDEELVKDREALERFVRWACAYEGELSVFFTPWGEALVRSWYREALTTLSHCEHIRRVAIQTNLSAGPGWTTHARRERLGLWSTWHPTEVSLDRFVQRVLTYRERGVRSSVGVVGLREHFDGIKALRAALPADVYLWINANKRTEGYYAPEDFAFLQEIDPYFALNARAHRSEGEPCHAGHTVLSVRGDGAVQRCHFVPTPLGNLYDPAFLPTLSPTPCSNTQCGCHIGYVHLERLGLYDLFGDGVLERIPQAWPQRKYLPIAG